ncbi:MAG: MerR family DNA-binding transcriptional regulator [Streptosporangiaceae bacterium]
MTLANNDMHRQAEDGQAEEDEPLDEPWCGTTAGYNRGHRCWRCREAWALKCRGPNRKWRSEHREELNARNRERRAQLQQDAEPVEKLLSTGQVAEILGVSRSTLHYWDRTGKLIPAERTPGGYRRYLKADLLAVLAGGAA